MIQVGIGKIGPGEVDGVPMVGAISSELRATQVGVGEVCASEIDGAVAVVGTVGSKLPVAQVGVDEVGSSEVDHGAAGLPTAGLPTSSELRTAQVGVVEVGPSEVDRTLPDERGIHELAVRQVVPAQVERLVRSAPERGAAAFDRPVLVAGGARLEHLQGARRGRRRWWWRAGCVDRAAQKGDGQEEHLAAREEGGGRLCRSKFGVVLSERVPQKNENALAIDVTVSCPLAVHKFAGRHMCFTPVPF